VEPGTPVEEAAKLFDPDELREGPGIVDYVVGASPGPGVFVLGTHENPVQRHYLELYKLGEGPLYCFTTPYHLCHFEVPTTVARAVCFGDATLAPSGGIRVEVVAAAKVDLSPGDELDGPGGYLTYGLAENVEVASLERLLPMGLAEGCTVTRPVAKDAVLTFEDVEVPRGRFVDGLRAEQNELFG
jgi:predicted homoserine dehydrogenase-like protein